VKLSVVIVCWNGRDLIDHCLGSIFDGTRQLEFEVILSDNGSTDGSMDFVRQAYPQVRIIENGSNLGYAKGNNIGIRECRGEYILLLNSDTIVQAGALETLAGFADRHPEAAAIGCEVLNRDGSPQPSVHRFPTVSRDWLDALCVPRFRGNKNRAHTWHSGCCLLFRADVLRQLGGFDEQFFYGYEDVDLCWRVWDSGHSIAYVPEARITHLGSQSAKRSPLRFELERHRSHYRFFYKHYGPSALATCRSATLARLAVRLLGYGLMNVFAPSDALRLKLKIYRIAARWNRRLDPVRFVERGEEPVLSAGESELLPDAQSLQ
jgi:hypothetical protein